MYLVKSCYQRDNIRIRKTIKIGTLTEYRDTEDEQIADRHEGSISLFFDLNNFHMPIPLHNQINTFSHASSNFHLKELQLRPNPLFSNHLYAKKYSAESSLVKLNRYIFCISALQNALMCQDIFKEYDDFWYFNSDRIKLFGDIISTAILKEINNRTNNNEELFTTSIKGKPLNLRWYANRIVYTQRDIEIDNLRLYKNQDEIRYYLSEGHMVKPKSFQHEQEFRFVFDIYCNGTLVHPLNKPLFADAQHLLPLIKN